MNFLRASRVSVTSAQPWIKPLIALCSVVFAPLALSSLPLGATAYENGSHRVLYRQTVMALSTDDKISQIDSLFEDGRGRSIGRLTMDLQDSMQVSALSYQSEDQGRFVQLQREAKRWLLNLRNERDFKPRAASLHYSKRDVVSALVPYVLSEKREQLLAGEMETLRVLFPLQKQSKLYSVHTKTTPSGLGDILRVDLVQSRLFSGDSIAISVEMLLDSGELLRYWGPDPCLCADERSVVLEFTN